MYLEEKLLRPKTVILACALQLIVVYLHKPFGTLKWAETDFTFIYAIALIALDLFGIILVFMIWNKVKYSRFLLISWQMLMVVVFIAAIATDFYIQIGLGGQTLIFVLSNNLILYVRDTAIYIGIPAVIITLLCMQDFDDWYKSRINAFDKRIQDDGMPVAPASDS